LDNPVLTSEKSASRFVLVFVAIVAIVLFGFVGLAQARKVDPYAQDVLSRLGNTVQGHAIFQVNCAGCHGLEADGRVGPSLRHVSDRKSKVRLIDQVISGKTPPMPKFQPQAQEMADLLSYLESL
jgi:mono/diheme cytochrome c family protein